VLADYPGGCCCVESWLSNMMICGCGNGCRDMMALTVANQNSTSLGFNVDDVG